MLTRRILLSVLTTVVLFVSGCKIETPPITITVDSDTEGSVSSQLSCAATLSPTVTSVISGQLIPVIIQVAGGTAPYSYLLVPGNFSSQITVNETFHNTESENIVLSKTYTVNDLIGNSASCSLAVTVIPEPIVDPAPLVCTFSVNKSTPAVGELVNFGVTVAGGLAPFTASHYTPGTYTTYASLLSQVSSSSFSSSAIYGTSGLNTASVQITDSHGMLATCSQVVNVAPAPSITVTATPSTTVSSGTPITLSAVTHNFRTTPEITFSTTSGGVTFTAVGNTIVVQTIDYLAHTVVVDIVASTATEQANSTLTLNFTNNQSLNCSLTYPASSTYYRVGDTIIFSVSATSGEALSITSLSAQDGTVLDSVGSSSARIRFNSSGYKTVYATARSASRGTLCNNGATLTSSIYISGAPINLSCSAVTNPTPSYAGEFFLVRAQVPAGVGVGTVKLVQIQTSWQAQTSYSYYNDSTSSYMAIYNAGSFPVVLTVQDEAGNTAQCSTNHLVYW